MFKFISVLSSAFITVILILNHTHTVCGSSSDSCDWIGSGLSSGGENSGVRPLYLRCRQGRIRWVYPRGGLRALLRPPYPTFRGCVRMRPESSGARLFLEGERRLFPLFKHGTAHAQMCFTSRRGQVALYAEADPMVDPLRKDVMEFSYDLEPQENLADDMEECRPCTDDEVLKSYCTSDFVVKGTVSSLSHNITTDTSELSVRTTFLKMEAYPYKPWRRAKYVTLHRPLKCGTKSGKGEFLFLGRWKLGYPVVQCAPRLSYWKEIRRKALQVNANLCQLD